MPNMAPRLTFGNTIADWQDRINVVRMREERAEKARQVMRMHGIAALLASRADNCRYLTGLRGPEFMPQLWYVLFFAEGDPVVFMHAGWISQMRDQTPWIKNWELARSWLGSACGPEAAGEEIKLFASEIHGQLTKRGLGGEKLAVVGIEPVGREALRELGVKMIEGWPMMLEARAIKTDDEINCLKMAAAICEVGWHKVWPLMKPGIRDTELGRNAVQALYEAGAEDVPHIGFLSGPLTFERGFSRTGRFLQTGDLVYAPMCGITYLGYKSCNYRTFIAGRKPNQKESDWYKKLLDRLDAVIDSIKPGATTADAAKHFPKSTSWGHALEAEVLTIEIGHGLGLSAYETPIINRQWSFKYPQVFEKGMTLAVESCEGEPRVGGVRLENMLVVTEHGAEILDYTPRDRILSLLE